MSTVETELREALESQAALLEQIAADPHEHATVVAVHDSDVKITTNNGSLTIRKSDRAELRPGDDVLIHPKTKQYLRHSTIEAVRTTGTVLELLDHLALVEVQGHAKFVPHAIEGLRETDRVLMDEFSAYILRVLPPKKPIIGAPAKPVHWDDVGGNAEAKEALRDAIELPTMHPEVYRFYGAEPPNGVLLFGPSGCGKTLLARAAATAIGSADGFFAVKGPEVLDPYVGVAESRVRALFDRSRRYHADTGKRAIIFIDEAEAILGARNARHAHMEKTIVPTFLAEMDGVQDACATVILATNLSHQLDVAVVREGRVDRRIEVARPDVLDSFDIATKHLRHVPTAEDRDGVAAHLVKQVFGATFQNNGARHSLATYVSGALIAGVVSKARDAAMKRDIAANTRTGLTSAEVDGAVEVTAREMSGVGLDQYTTR